MGYDKVSRFGGFWLGSLKARSKSDHDRLLLQRSDQQKQETKEKRKKNLDDRIKRNRYGILP